MKGLGEVFELLPAYSGLLLTLAGGPLRREAVVRKTHRDPGVGEYDSWALAALYAIVLPHVLAVPGASEFLLKLHGQIIIIIGTLLTFLGFISLLQGLWKLTETDHFGRVTWWDYSSLLRFASLQRWGSQYTYCPTLISRCPTFSNGHMPVLN